MTPAIIAHIVVCPFDDQVMINKVTDLIKF